MTLPIVLREWLNTGLWAQRQIHKVCCMVQFHLNQGWIQGRGHRAWTPLWSATLEGFYKKNIDRNMFWSSYLFPPYLPPSFQSCRFQSSPSQWTFWIHPFECQMSTSHLQFIITTLQKMTMRFSNIGLTCAIASCLELQCIYKDMTRILTGEPHLTATSLIRPPRYYGQYFFTRQTNHTFPEKKTPLMRPPP